MTTAICCRPTFVCLAALSTAFCAAPAFASSQTHVLKPKETLEALARHYHVSVHDLIRTNAIHDPENLAIGRRLLIPSRRHQDASASTAHHSESRTTHPVAHRSGPDSQHVARSGVVVLKEDGIRLRSGPSTSRHCLDTLDQGTHVHILERRDGWARIKLPGGKQGWVRADFLVHKKESKATRHLVGHPSTKKERHEVAERKARHLRHLAQLTKDNQGRIAPHKTREERRHAARLARLHEQHLAERAAHLARLHKKHLGEQEAPLARLRHRHEEAARLARSHKRRQHEEAQQVARHPRHQDVTTRHLARGQELKLSHGGGLGEVVRTAYAYRGTPYVWGGASRGGFDCSGFTMHLLGRRGISVPHSARGQFNMGHHVGRDGMKPGDLVFFHTVTPGISHVGMYVGNGHFVHASSRRSGGVRVDSLSSGYYSHALRGARRF